MKRVQQIYPVPIQEKALNGLYLEHAVHKLGSPEHPFVYANFLSSLDGRISLIDPDSGRPYLPKILANPDDFRLFLELHAQADCLITHGAYLRAMMKGTLGNILQTGTSEATSDLADWRKAQGLEGQPAVVIASASLDFPIPPSIKQHRQVCYIATGRQSDPERIRHWEKAGYRVIIAGQGQMVQGEPLVAELGKLGYRSLYLIAGPRMLDTMLRENKLSRLYQTISLQLLGGEAFHTLVPGPPLGPAGRLQLRQLVYDAAAKDHSAQLFAQFDISKLEFRGPEWS
ncbi:MAG: dihydrofolate reductase family protein [Methylococcaceae bacterium]|nr:dihydrofolate reductase family protein [Methylococcaceae bacterium]MCI0667927.1 dihydrofolate reductase family protein [Methylococcaceae bacterium]MCI0733505.1 dihydrofolate reductase family protein [Methylococcaceae bacterium]